MLPIFWRQRLLIESVTLREAILAQTVIIVMPVMVVIVLGAGWRLLTRLIGRGWSPVITILLHLNQNMCAIYN